MKTTDIIDSLPDLLDKLIGSAYYNIHDLTCGRIRNIANKRLFPGVYLFSLDSHNNYVYVGRSKNIVVRLGTDHRSKDKNLAPVTGAIRKEFSFPTMVDARKKLFKSGLVRFIEVEDVNTRAMLEIYIANELCTKYNSFLEH